jgi:DNA-binding NarL/FixJ family response regulator
MTTTTPCVLLAEPLFMVRQSLKALLENASFHIIAEPVDGPETIQLAKQEHPDAAILDFSMPGLNGIAIARRLSQLSRPIPSILLTTSAEKEDVAMAMAAGVKGYVLKSQSGSQLIEALREVLRGGLYLSPAIDGDVVRKVLSSANLYSAAITEREREVLKLVAEGKAVREVGDILALSPQAVGLCRKRIMAKLQVRKTAGLVRYAVRHGIIEA